MDNTRIAYCKKLLEMKLITDNQFQLIETYRGRNLFSVRTELRVLLYISVLLFTSGMGILIYENIDTIGHMSILMLLLVVTAVCFYFSFKKSNGFKRTETGFENPIFDYLVLAGVSLSCIFVGYLQFQYNAFGAHYGLATIIPTLIAFGSAYYFDNRSTLSIGITGLTAYVGLSVSPQALLYDGFYEDSTLSYSALLLGVLLFVWTLYATKVNLKKHFNFVYLTFSLHLISLALLMNLFQDNWFWYIIPLIVSSYFFYKSSYENRAISLLVFAVLYAFIGFTVFIVRVFDSLNRLEDLFEGLLILSPIYFIVLIVLFVKLIKNFNKNTSNDSI